MAVEFRIKSHSVIPGISVVEIVRDGNVVGVMYPKDDGVVIISAHFSETEKDLLLREKLCPMTVAMFFHQFQV